jgi:hypothetical protein
MADYSLKLTDFLKELCPEFTLPTSLSFLKDQTINTLNLLLKLVKELYEVSKDNIADISSAFIHVINFYIGTKNATNWAELSVGFASLALSLFKLDGVKQAASHIQRIVGLFFENLKKYFIKAEALESNVKSFWTDVTVTNPRTLFGMVHACSGILTSVICLKNFVHESFDDGDIISMITHISEGIFKVGSEVRQHAESISLFLARVYDWIFVNAEVLMKLQFDKIKWELPADQIFESKFVEMTNIMNSYLEDPLYLEANNLTLEVLRDKLNKLRSTGEVQLNKNPSPSVKAAIARYLTILDGHLRVVGSRLNPDNTKPQPMSITLIGAAGCGKSSASTKLGLMMQAIAGRVPDESLLNNRGGDPKFEENIDSTTDVIIYDDYANDQSVKMTTKNILDIVNTSKEVIPKARADEKGDHKYCNIGTLFNTNDENIGINLFDTVSLDSLIRRLGLAVCLAIHDEYCIPGTDRLDLNHPDVSKEIFNTDVYKVLLKIPIGVLPPVNGFLEVKYKIIPYERRPGNNEWRDAVLKIQELLHAQWSNNVSRHLRAKSKENLCPKCSLPIDVCMCVLLDKEAERARKVALEAELAQVIALDAERAQEKALQAEKDLQAESLDSCRSNLKSLFFKKPVASATQRFYSLDTRVLDFSSLLTTRLSLYVYYKNVSLYYSERAQVYYANRFRVLSLIAIFSMIPFGVFILMVLTYFYERRVIRAEREAQFERDITTGSAIAEAIKMRYSIYGVTFISGAFALAAIFSSLITISGVVIKSEDSKVTKVESPKDEEIQFVLPKEKSNSDSIGYFITKPRPAHEARTMTPAQVLAEIGKGIAQVTIKGDDNSTSTVKCLPMGSERLIPRHALPLVGVMDVTLRATNKLGARYNNVDVPQTHISNLTKSNLFTTKILDAALVHLPNAPPGKDFTKYLAEEGTMPPQAACQYIHKNCDDGTYEIIPVRARLLKAPIQYKTSNTTEVQYVYECKAQYHTSSEGDCGQPLVYNNAVIGIHIAGNVSNVWYCLAIDRSTVNKANAILKQESSLFVASTPSDPVFKNNLKGFSIIDEPTDYVNKVLNTPVTPIVSLGTVLDVGMKLHKPRAEDYYFRNGNTQIEQEFGDLSSRPPRFVNGVTQINTTLLKFNTPKMDVPIELMDRAMNDYVRGTTIDGSSVAGVAALFEKEDPGFFSVRSLSQALDGDQTGVVRGMNNQTSSGVCYGGKKTKHMHLDADGDVLIPRELNDYVEADILTLENAWRSGQGTFDPFVRASKTNEVLPLKKAAEKTRSVYGNDMSFFIAATRGIIPLKHVLRNMEISECYVGLAAQSTEWSELHDYLTFGGKFTKFVCGDFSGYDTQLPKALLEKSAAIILQLYRENGASSSDLEYLRGFLSSVVSPAMIWEGNLLQFCSGQPSGQPLTVEMNSIVNSILVRMAFFTIMKRDYPRIKNPNFRDYVRLAVYGDDNVMGIHDDIPLFNHTTIQAVFASWGIQYTMADKEADSIPYLSISEISFLKRSFVRHEQLDSIVAPIEEESLSKKFYWWTKSKNTPLNFVEQFQANFESQAREAYLHGEDFYVEFCAKCERIIRASEDGDERFVLPWNTIQPLSPLEMRNALISAYHPEDA